MSAVHKGPVYQMVTTRVSVKGSGQVDHAKVLVLKHGENTLPTSSLP